MTTTTINTACIALAFASGLCFCLPACDEGQRDPSADGAADVARAEDAESQAIEGEANQSFFA